MTTNCIKKDCPNCPNIHTMFLKANNVVKCPSCLREYHLLENGKLKHFVSGGEK